MADTFYAWSEIKYDAEVDEDGNRVSDASIAAGESVSQSDLGVSDADWDALVESGAVRNYKYPEMPDTFNGSPVDFLRQQTAEVAGAVEGSGGGYFGPPMEEALSDPESVGVLTEEAEAKAEEEASEAEPKAKTTATTKAAEKK